LHYAEEICRLNSEFLCLSLVLLSKLPLCSSAVITMPPYGLVLKQLDVTVTILMREEFVAVCRE
jgi:hypothetical protein